MEAMAVEVMPVVEVMVEEEMVAVGCATDDSTSDADDELAANKPAADEHTAADSNWTIDEHATTDPAADVSIATVSMTSAASTIAAPDSSMPTRRARVPTKVCAPSSGTPGISRQAARAP